MTGEISGRNDKFGALSVFLPAFNEEGNIKEVVVKTKKVLQEVAGKWEIVIVNDGSGDSTKKIVEDLQKEDPRIKLVNHDKNRGYGASFKSGLYNSKYNWIAFIDSDGQFDFAEITKFLEKQKETGADIVIGYYEKRRVSKFKIITSKIWEFSVFILFGLKVHDIDCGFKLISKRVIDKIPPLVSERGAFISSELLIKARNAGFKIVEVPVTHYPRLKGVGTGRNLNVIIKSFIDLLRLWKKLH
jgi:glycosyltransferase involved in cell wall biosynthesis